MHCLAIFGLLILLFNHENGGHNLYLHFNKSGMIKPSNMYFEDLLRIKRELNVTPLPENYPRPQILESKEKLPETESTSEPGTSFSPMIETGPNSDQEITFEKILKTTLEPELISEPVLNFLDPWTKSEANSATYTEPAVILEPEPTPEPKTEPESNSETQSEPYLNTRLKSDPGPTSVPELKSEPWSNSAPNSEQHPEPEPEPEPEPDSKPDLEPESNCGPNIEPEPLSEPGSVLGSNLEPVLISLSSPEPELIAGRLNGQRSRTEFVDCTANGTIVEPESEQEAISEAEINPLLAEPVPEWDEAMQKYKWGWNFLVYVFATLFLFLGLYCVSNIVCLLHMKHLFSRNYFIMLNILILIICVLRGLYLSIDAHNRNDTFHEILNHFLYSTTFPCLTSAFSILFYALLLATRVQVLSARIQKLSVLLAIIAFHFTLSIAADIIVGIFASAGVLLQICQFVYIIWGTILFIAFFYIFRKLHTAAAYRSKISIYRGKMLVSAHQNRRTTVRLNSSVIETHLSKQDKIARKKYNLNTTVKVTLVSAVLGVMCVLIELYGMFGVYKIYKDRYIPAAWPFFAYQFLLRLLEYCMCCLMVYVTTQPFKFGKKSSKHFGNFCHRLRGLFFASQVETSTEFELNLTNNSQYQLSCDANNNIEQNKAKMKRKVSVKRKPHFCHVLDTEMTTLPDLVFDTVQEKYDSANNNETDMLEEKYLGKESDAEFHNETLDCNQSKPRYSQKSGNLTEDFDNKSLSTSSTFGSELNLTVLNLMDCFEEEYDKAYERSFTQESPTKVSDLASPSFFDFTTSTLEDSQLYLLEIISQFEKNDSVEKMKL